MLQICYFIRLSGPEIDLYYFALDNVACSPSECETYLSFWLGIEAEDL